MAKRDRRPAPPVLPTPPDSAKTTWIDDGPATEGEPQKTFPPPPSEQEAKNYYAGLRSRPILVARSGTTPWEEPTDPEAQPQPKEIKGFGGHGHAIKKVWEGDLKPKVTALLRSMEVNWNRLDVVRIGNEDEWYTFAPVILWIGVPPGSLSGAVGAVVVRKCRELLEEYTIFDVDVEIRETIVTHWL